MPRRRAMEQRSMLSRWSLSTGQDHARMRVPPLRSTSSRPREIPAQSGRNRAFARTIRPRASEVPNFRMCCELTRERFCRPANWRANKRERHTIPYDKISRDASLRLGVNRGRRTIMILRARARAAYRNTGEEGFPRAIGIGRSTD